MNYFTKSSSVSQEVGVLSRKPGTRSSTWSLSGPVRFGVEATCTPSSRAMQFCKLSMCYECRMIVDPDRYQIPRTTICACSQHGEIFPKIESSELHQAVHHANQDPSIRTLQGVESPSTFLPCQQLILQAVLKQPRHLKQVGDIPLSFMQIV